MKNGLLSIVKHFSNLHITQTLVSMSSIIKPCHCTNEAPSDNIMCCLPCEVLHKRSPPENANVESSNTLHYAHGQNATDLKLST